MNHLKKNISEFFLHTNPDNCADIRQPSKVSEPKGRFQANFLNALLISDNVYFVFQNLCAKN